MKRIFLLCVLIIIALTACQLPGLQSLSDLVQRVKPEDVNQTQPTPSLTIDNSYFAGLGCFEDPACLPDDLKKLDPPITAIREPADVLGGLDPALPLAVGSTVLYQDEVEIPSVYVHRCMRNLFIRYLVFRNGRIELVDSVDKLSDIYAPIDSAEEALSYAVAATGYTALFDLGNRKKLEFYNPLIEPTSVTNTGGGYKLTLFNTYLCGCGPHIIYSVDVTVSPDGTLEVADLQPAYSDPEYDGLCID